MTNLNELGLCEWVVPYVKQLCDGDTGFCVGGVKIESPFSSSPPSDSDIPRNDIFTVAVPFGGEVIRWQFIFDGQNERNLPDVLFPGFGFDDFDPEFDDIKSLSDWESRDFGSLLTAVQEIVELFKEHQRKVCCAVDKNLSNEILELLEEPDFANAEIYLKRNIKTLMPKSLNVLLKLPVDFSELLKKSPAEFSAVDKIIRSPLLLVKFDLEARKAVPTLFLPSHVEQLIGGKDHVAIPPYSVSSTILHYVKKVHKKLTDAVSILSTSHGKRCEYVAAYLRQFPSDILEYDAENFRSLSLVFSYQTFYVFVHIKLSKFFPQSQPVITLQSAYHLTKQEDLMQKTFTHYPYSPRWSGSEMAKRTKSFLIDSLPAFKDNCIRNGVL